MLKSSIQLQLELSNRVTPWLKETLAIQQFCIDSGLPLPSVMQPLFAEALNGSQQKDIHSVNGPKGNGTRNKKEKDGPIKRRSYEFTLPSMPNYGPRPEGVGPDWKAVPLDSASSLNLTLYIIKQEGGAASSSTINAKLPILRPGTASSTGAMSLYTLKEDDRISGDSREWALTRDVEIVISGQRMWCSLEQLRQQDRAGLRREVILAALKVNPSGLTVRAASELLYQCEWLSGVACEPDMVKGDIRILNRDGLIQKDGAFWKLKD